MSVNSCVAVSRQIIELMQVDAVSVKIRSDTWFLDDTSYPYVFRFVKNLQVPDISQFQMTPHLTCGKWHGESILCGGDNFGP
jgi:hypothetical protein